MSKNRLRWITLVRGPICGIHSLTLIISCHEPYHTTLAPTSLFPVGKILIYANTRSLLGSWPIPITFWNVPMEARLVRLISIKTRLLNLIAIMKEVYRVQSISDMILNMLQIYALSEKIWKLWNRDLHRWLTKNNDYGISEILRYSSQNQNTR